MKKILLLLVISATVLFFAGCSLVTPYIEDIEINVTGFEQIEDGEVLLINVQLENISDGLLVVDKICFIITFNDGTEIEKDINVGITLLIGEEKNERIVALLFSDKFVTSAEVTNFEYY